MVLRRLLPGREEFNGRVNGRVSKNHVPWHRHWKAQDEMEELDKRSQGQEQPL